MIKKYFRLSILKIFFIFFIVFMPIGVYSGNLTNSNDVLGNVAGHSGAGYIVDNTASFEAIVGAIIKTFLTLSGVIFLAILVYGGYVWMTGLGNSERVDKSKKLISAAIIGLIITFASYAISIYVIERMAEKTLTEEARN